MRTNLTRMIIQKNKTCRQIYFLLLMMSGGVIKDQSVCPLFQNNCGKSLYLSYWLNFLLGYSKPKIKISDVPKTAESHDRKPLTIIIGNNVTALTDTNITIQCNASGAPTPTVTWTIDSHSISSGEKYKIQDDGSLLISKTSQKYIARYNCIAESVAGKDSASSTVRIVGKYLGFKLGKDYYFIY